jgi:hypothetical protein
MMKNKKFHFVGFVSPIKRVEEAGRKKHGNGQPNELKLEGMNCCLSLISWLIFFNLCFS